MITSNDIMLTVNALIAAKYTKITVYRERCPKDFKRPSFLLEQGKSDQKDATRNTVNKSSSLTITCFATIDEHYRSEISDLTDLQEGIISIFSCGFVKIRDRAIKVQGLPGGIDVDRSYVDLQFDYFDNRTDAADNTPLIASVKTNLKEG
jgi:hypothetical protein